MHFDFIGEGWKPDVEKMEDWLNTRTFDMPVVNKDGKTVWIQVPGALRVRRMYTYVFPRGSLDQVIKTLKPSNAISMVDGVGTNILGMSATAMRKLLRLKKIPDINNSVKEFPMMQDWKKNIRILGLGIRDDIDIKFDSGITHEGL